MPPYNGSDYDKSSTPLKDGTPKNGSDAIGPMGMGVSGMATISDTEDNGEMGGEYLRNLIEQRMINNQPRAQGKFARTRSEALKDLPEDGAFSDPPPIDPLVIGGVKETITWAAVAMHDVRNKL